MPELVRRITTALPSAVNLSILWWIERSALDAKKSRRRRH
jgi:hypothetical protein